MAPRASHHLKASGEMLRGSNVKKEARGEHMREEISSRQSRVSGDELADEVDRIS